MPGRLALSSSACPKEEGRVRAAATNCVAQQRQWQRQGWSGSGWFCLKGHVRIGAKAALGQGCQNVGRRNPAGSEAQARWQGRRGRDWGKQGGALVCVTGERGCGWRVGYSGDVGQVNQWVGLVYRVWPAKKKCFWFSLFIFMNTEVEIKSRKISRFIRKIWIYFWR
jgi:hypothetical protein